MDQRTEYIRQDIDATREAMTDKLEMIESKVKGTVDDLKGSVENTVETVKENVKQAFDIKQQVNERPWMMLGASVVAGYVLGSLGESSDAPNYNYRTTQYRSGYSDNSAEPTRYYSNSSAGSSYNQPESYSSYGSSYSRPASSTGSSATSAVAGLLDQFGLEFDTLKDAAVVTVGNMLRDMMKKNLPQFAEEFERARQERERQQNTSSSLSESNASQSYDPLERSVGSTGDASSQDRPAVPSNPTTTSSTIRNADAVSNADRNTIKPQTSVRYSCFFLQLYQPTMV